MGRREGAGQPDASGPPTPGGVRAGFEDGTTQVRSGCYGDADPVVTTDPPTRARTPCGSPRARTAARASAPTVTSAPARPARRPPTTCTPTDRARRSPRSSGTTATGRPGPRPSPCPPAPAGGRRSPGPFRRPTRSAPSAASFPTAGRGRPACGTRPRGDNGIRRLVRYVPDTVRTRVRAARTTPVPRARRRVRSSIVLPLPGPRRGTVRHACTHASREGHVRADGHERFRVRLGSGGCRPRAHGHARHTAGDGADGGTAGTATAVGGAVRGLRVGPLGSPATDSGVARSPGIPSIAHRCRPGEGRAMSGMGMKVPRTCPWPGEPSVAE